MRCTVFVILGIVLAIAAGPLKSQYCSHSCPFEVVNRLLMLFNIPDASGDKRGTSSSPGEKIAWAYSKFGRMVARISFSLIISGSDELRYEALDVIGNGNASASTAEPTA